MRLFFPPADTDEFHLLNETLNGVVEKAQKDYFILKEFTENASHEMQTPLAILRSKFDLLIQSDDLTEAQSQTLQGSYDAIQSMKKLNQSLLLLAKIENQQFSGIVTIDIVQAIANKQKQFAEQWKSNGIKVDVKAQPDTIAGDPELIDILLNNLLSNATRHNIKDGFICISVANHTLRIDNSGEAKPLDAGKIFNRFYKTSNSGGQHGLGLSIVKQICEVSAYQCTYHFAPANIHSFTITW